jgi:hypothetical protein
MFKAPEPIVGETYDNYFRRLIQAFEDWVNETAALTSEGAQGT